MTDVQVELLRRTAADDVVPWLILDDGREPVLDVEVRDAISALTQAQLIDENNSAVLSNVECGPGRPWTGEATETYSKKVVGVHLQAISPGSPVAGKYVFEFGSDGENWPVHIEAHATDFSVIKWRRLFNIPKFYRAGFEPDEELPDGVVVVVDSILLLGYAPEFVIPATHVLEQSEFTGAPSFVLPMMFKPDGFSTNWLGTEGGAAFIKQEDVETTPSGALFIQGFTRYVRHDFGTDAAADSIARMINLSAGGTATPNPDGGAWFSADPGQDCVFLSNRRVPYSDNPGHGVLGDQTFLLDPASVDITGGAYAEWGWCGSDGPGDGFGWGYDALGFYTYLRKSGNDTFKTYQDSWSDDKCNGPVLSPLSRYTRGGAPSILDIRKDNLYREKGEFLYAAEQTFELKAPRGRHVTAHVNEYPNGFTETSLKSANLHQFVKIHNPAGQVGTITLLSGSWVGGLFSSQQANLVERSDSPGDLAQLTGTAFGSRITLDTNVVNLEEGITLKPLPKLVTGQSDINAFSTVALPPVPLADQATLEFTNPHATVDVYYSETAEKVENQQGSVIMARCPKAFDLEAGKQLHFRLQDAGGTSTVSTRNGTATTAVTAVTTPDNILTSNDARAIFTGLTSTLEITGVSNAGAGDSIADVVLRLEGRKDPAAPVTLTVGFVDAVTGQADNTTAVVSGTVTANPDHTYLVAVSRRNLLAAVTSVTGMGATWERWPGADVTGGASRLDLWYNTTPVVSSGALTAALSAAGTNSVIGVLRFSNVDPAIFDSFETLTSGVSATGTYSDSIVGAALGMAVTFIDGVNRTVVPGSGFTEVLPDVVNGQAALEVAALQLAASGAQAYTGTLSGTSLWSLIAVTLKPRPVTDPVMRVYYQPNGAPVGTSFLEATLSSTSDAVYQASVFVDRDWAPSDFPVALFVSVTALNGAAAQVDCVNVLETDSTGANVVRLCYDQIGGVSP